MKFFAPSVEIFKAFMSIFIPFILIIILALIWGILYMISNKKFGNFKRNIIISVICTLFLLHPNLTKQSLSLFECISIGEGIMRMRTNMDYGCYSAEHIKWIGIVGIPSLIIWVIASPVLAFVILYKSRNRLEDESVKKYYLILYQGLTRKVFYWEFVNTIRKVIIIGFNTILSVISINYRLFLCVVLLVIVERLQKRLKPYKLKENNTTEIKAIVAGATVLFSGLLFEEGIDHNYPGFEALAMIVIVIYNLMFLLLWTHLFLCSFNFRNENIKKGLEIFGFLICNRTGIAKHQKLDKVTNRE